MISSSSGIVGATQWLQGLLSGGLIFGLATIGILAVGFALLSGRVPVRRGTSTIIGCFVMLGAGSIAQALIDQPDAQRNSSPIANQFDNALMPPKVVQKTNDPYAGSSLIPN